MVSLLCPRRRAPARSRVRGAPSESLYDREADGITTGRNAAQAPPARPAKARAFSANSADRVESPIRL